MRCKASDCFRCPYPDCINPSPLRVQVRTREQQDRINARAREKRAALKAAGLCSTCGRPRDNPRWLLCGYCRGKRRLGQEQTNRKRGHLPRCLLDGIDRCSHCGRAAPATGQKLCEKCLADARAALARTRNHTGKGCATPFAKGVNAFWEGQKGMEVLIDGRLPSTAR